MASVHGEASQLEVKLVGMIEDLRRSDDVNDVHLLNKQIRQYMDELRTKIKVKLLSQCQKICVHFEYTYLSIAWKC